MKARLAIASTAWFIAAAVHGPAFADAKADASNVDTACAADAKTTGCTGQVVGKGLLKCMDAYKKANKTFTHTPGCLAAMKQFHADEKGGAAPPAAGAPPAAAPATTK
jgi:hypothetical protein